MLKKGLAGGVILFSFLLISCHSHYSPKPRGYFRIDLPKHAYRSFDSTFPYRFSYPVYAKISNDPLSPEQKYWMDIHFPQFKATLHISYRTIHHNLRKYLEDSRKMVVKHIPKANAIHDSLIIDPKRNVFGMAYDIEGSGVASPYQFILTDSIRHFLRGSLYFRVEPNNDSLAPVIRFIKQDIRHFIQTLQWENPGNKSTAKIQK
ncbi:gliding motility lipoprotein GldD [Candidatus Sulfidibacterium hydrothermale]|uniref:gliding motility lipoprotein GldD n=1 Tax=Candidatus Sulfidibacterium hydrothermale TaxID=2875962 RepID=UPI001F0A86BC|nr:gliding motility lipoprotein GldD [Candidatus Sulfidibacterium hydrothermale]UBM62834.1 gliding motility lipoprotein GldD [Candidatus Sulfidibacterium hydrothermale]